MRFLFIPLFIFAAGLISAPGMFAADVCATPTNLVANCGFDSGDFTSWTVTGTDSDPSKNGQYYGIENSSQFSGNFAAFFGAAGGEISLNQTLSGLIPTDIYTISLEAFNDTTPDTGYINNLYIALGPMTDLVASQTPANGYTLYTAVIAATSTTEDLSILSRNDAGFWNIDSIQAMQTGVPEPAVFALFAAGLALVAGYMVIYRLRRGSRRTRGPISVRASHP